MSETKSSDLEEVESKIEQVYKRLICTKERLEGLENSIDLCDSKKAEDVSKGESPSNKIQKIGNMMNDFNYQLDKINSSILYFEGVLGHGNSQSGVMKSNDSIEKH